MRARAVIDSKGKVTLLSSEETVLTKYPQIVSALEALHYANIEFDGELYRHGLDFNEIMQDTYKESLEYHIFDIVLPGRPQYMRTIGLNALIQDSEAIKRVKAVEVSTLDEVLRHHNALYERKRSTALMKFKPKKEDIYKIVGYQEEISITGSAKGSMGALILDSMLDCSGIDTTFNVGTGFTRNQRIELWRIREELVGQYARVKYQHISSANHVPRFPVFIDIYDPTK
jgi:ATP-dependent DNA ligase